MSGAAMRSTAATSGFVIFLLSASVIQAQNDMRVIYYRTQICALKGSTVNLHCSCTPSSRINDADPTVERAFWFTKTQDEEPVDLRTDPEYAGRVQYSHHDNVCTLTITDLRESDSAVYRFRSTDRRYTGEPGVTLLVTGFQVQISKTSSCVRESCVWADLKCHSSCLPTSFSWYENGVKMNEERKSFNHYFYPANSYSCAARGLEAFPSPSVCVAGQYCNRVTYADRRICAFKGSSVNISCTYVYNGYYYNPSKFWFNPERSWEWQYQTQPEDLSKDLQYAGRVQVLETERGRSTLTITDLRESDSAEYRFKFKKGSFDWRSSLPGTTLTVTEPDVQVQVIWSSTGPKLICHSSCPPSGRSSFVWYQNETKKIPDETSPSYRGNVDPANSYSCAYQSYRSPPVYAPRVPLVLPSHPGDIMEGSSVTLTCSSDAKPAAKYTWYKENQQVLREEPQLVFSSIQSFDSGQYHCTAENQLGRTSAYVSIDVKYAPKLPSVSVSPSAEIVEGSSVNLTCSSDANPAATYTWYKGNQTLLQGPEGVYHFTSISSEDSGIYYCKSENQYRRINSTSLVLDVQYAPKLPSVSVSPSEIVEGSSVNLTCSSDANPAANYTWYKEDEDSPKASGHIFTITNFRAEHSGNYSCEAQNTRGRSHSFHRIVLAVSPGAWKSAVAGTTTVLLAIVLLAVFLWIRRKKSFTRQSNGGERADNRAQLNTDAVYYVACAPAPPAEHLHYSSVRFAQKPEEAVYSNIRPARPHGQTEEDYEDDVDYTTVKTDRASGAPRTKPQEDEEDSFALYSTVNR